MKGHLVNDTIFVLPHISYLKSNAKLEHLAENLDWIRQLVLHSPSFEAVLENKATEKGDLTDVKFQSLPRLLV